MDRCLPMGLALYRKRRHLGSALTAAVCCLAAGCTAGPELPVVIAPAPASAIHLALVHAHAQSGRVFVTGDVSGRSGPVTVTVSAEGCRNSTIRLWITPPPRSPTSSFADVLPCSGDNPPKIVTVSASER